MGASDDDKNGGDDDEDDDSKDDNEVDAAEVEDDANEADDSPRSASSRFAPGGRYIAPPAPVITAAKSGVPLPDSVRPIDVTADADDKEYEEADAADIEDEDEDEDEDDDDDDDFSEDTDCEEADEDSVTVTTCRFAAGAPVVAAAAGGALADFGGSFADAGFPSPLSLSLLSLSLPSLSLLPLLPLPLLPPSPLLLLLLLPLARASSPGSAISWNCRFAGRIDSLDEEYDEEDDDDAEPANGAIDIDAIAALSDIRSIARQFATLSATFAAVFRDGQEGEADCSSFSTDDGVEDDDSAIDTFGDEGCRVVLVFCLLSFGL
jgi:hypothetical protein